MEKLTNNGNPRERIAWIISIGVPAATGVLAFIAIVFAIAVYKSGAKDCEREALNILKYTFTAMLPLWGTWIGTVLAYYFSKENFEAANKRVDSLVSHVISSNEKLQKTKAKDVMIKLGTMFKLSIDASENPNTIKIKDCLDKLKTSDRKRLPITQDGKLIYIIHKSTFDSHLSASIMNTTGIDFLTMDIQAMIDSTDTFVKNNVLNSAEFIHENATLFEVKTLMDSNAYCSDVFMTENGRKDEPILGWITDVIVTKNATV